MRVFIGIVILALVTAGSIFAFNSIVSLPEPDASKVAVAIQAIGSVVAILIAVAVPAWLHVKAEESKESERKIFAAAYSLHLLPQLLKIRTSLQWTVTNLGKHIEGLDDPKMGVEFDDHSDNIHEPIQFIANNWSAVARLDGETARAVVKATKHYYAALEYIDIENGVQTMGNGEGEEWYAIDFGPLPNAQGYLEENRRALDEVNRAIAQLEMARTERS